MDTGMLIAIIAIAVVVVLLGMYLARRRRSVGLRDRFGPEYERTVARTGTERDAEAELQARERRHRELSIVELEPEARARYQQAWRTTQTRFVDDPTTATREADLLVMQVMQERGYPMDDFEQWTADVSVDHPDVAENYRAAHALNRANEQGLATTDDLRQAFVHYRSLFAQLLDVEGDVRKEAQR
jgi:FtsZ-interacting cell division protein ZipA